MTCNGPYLYRGSMYIHTSLHHRLEEPCISMHRHRSGREYRHGPLDVVRRPRGDSWVDLTVERVQCALRKLGLDWKYSVGAPLSEAFRRRVSASYARLIRLDLRSTGVSFWNLLFASFSPTFS